MQLEKRKGGEHKCKRAYNKCMENDKSGLKTRGRSTLTPTMRPLEKPLKDERRRQLSPDYHNFRKSDCVLPNEDGPDPLMLD